jgi:hypothetical protein
MHVKSSLQRASGASTAGRGCQKAIDVVDRFFHDLLDKELLFFLALPDVVDKEGLAVGIRACRPRAALKVCPGRGPALRMPSPIALHAHSTSTRRICTWSQCAPDGAGREDYEGGRRVRAMRDYLRARAVVALLLLLAADLAAGGIPGGLHTCDKVLVAFVPTFSVCQARRPQALVDNPVSSVYLHVHAKT